MGALHRAGQWPVYGDVELPAAKETPPAYVGRVFGIQNSLSSVVLVAAPLAGGALIRSVGPSPTFQYIGMATLAIGVAGMLLQRILWEGNSRIQQSRLEESLDKNPSDSRDIIVAVKEEERGAAASVT
ncbi:hypothetical protein [Paenibacillus sp. 1A_MP2]|uniref:hypothetical protein n=1 Tax=Paenibacillus sp. 1A_MP2 TaxID=3457495 RepID=UPI003FCC6C1A